MEQFQSRGRLIAGVSFDIPGMGYKNPRTGVIEGFEANLARAISEKLLGAPGSAELFPITDENRIKALQEGLVDMVVSQLTITPDRAEQVDFSIPYYVTREGILVLAGSSIRSFEDLAGKRIAVTAGSISLRRMRAALSSLPGATLVITTLGSGNVEAVAKGEADAASNDLVDLTFLRSGSEHPDQYELIDIGDKFEPKPFGIAVKKGSPALVGLLNEAIETFQANGAIDRLMDEAIASVGNMKNRPVTI